MIKKLFPALLFLLSMQPVTAQKKVTLEKFRNYTSNDLRYYWQSAEIRKAFVQQLSQILLRHRQLSLTDTANFNIQFPKNDEEASTVTLDFDDADTNHVHMYLNLYEFKPNLFFSAIEKGPFDSALLNRTRNVFAIQALVVTSSKEVLFNEVLNIVVSHAQTAGMGTLYGNGIPFSATIITPKGFTEMLKAAADILFNPKNELMLVEIKVPPAYYADNYILPKTASRARTHVSTAKDISIYQYNGKQEMIRAGEAIYEEIRIKGKNAEKYPDVLTAAIKNTEHFSSSDFVFLRQESRDVVRDKNYLLKMVVQLDPFNRPAMPQYAFTNFLPGNFHYLLHEKDTLATFTIDKGIIDPDKKLYPDKVSNGFDSSSFFIFPAAQPIKPVLYDYVVTGKISNQDFSIKCSGYRNTVKEIFLSGKLICIAQGKFSPEKFVVFDASLSPELLNQLFMIGFNRFFE